MASLAASDPAAATPAIVFVGFMGAGKSKAVQAAAELGLEVIDTDRVIEHELGSSIGEYFEAHGEAAFREREEQIVAKLLDEADGQAIAAGGGSVLSERVRRAMERHLVIWLDVSAEKAWSRVAGKRPLAEDRDGFSTRLDERRPLYGEVADIVIPAQRERVRSALPAILALRSAPPGTKLLWARNASRDYPVFIGRGLLDGMQWPLSSRRFVVTDSNVAAVHADRLGDVAGRVEIDPGEERKTIAEAERVLRELVALGVRRDDHLVALGGGVVGDLAGFCAAVYQRGIPVVQVPTTLVSQVDSAYGGKTGVDLPEAKNYVGAYHQPAAVLTDPGLLETLPDAERAAGYSEVLKTALIAGGELWEAVRAADPAALPGDEVIAGCAQTKLDVVASDERDAGGRAVLNLGHTVGHAIEAASDYGRYRHGEAIALGLLAALRLSGAEELRGEVRGLLERAGLPVQLDAGVGEDAVIEAVGRDKKRTQEGVGFVLIERPGETSLGEKIEEGDLRAAVKELYA